MYRVGHVALCKNSIDSIRVNWFIKWKVARALTKMRNLAAGATGSHFCVGFTKRPKHENYRLRKDIAIIQLERGLLF